MQHVGFTSFVEYLNGEMPVDRQRYRDQVLSTSVNDLKDYAERLDKCIKSASVVVFGSQAALEQANKELSTPLVIESAVQQ